MRRRRISPLSCSRCLSHLYTLSLTNKLSSAKFSSASIFKVLQCRSNFVKMLSECQHGFGRDGKLLSVSSGSKLFACGTLVVIGRLRVKHIEEKAHAGNATQNIYPPLMQKTRIHIQPHTLHHSCIN